MSMRMAGTLVLGPSFPMQKSCRGAQVAVGGGFQGVRATRLFELGFATQQLSRRARSRRSRRIFFCKATLTDQADVPVGESDSTQALQKLKELIDVEGGNSTAADEGDLLRFLRAQSFNTDQAAKAFANHQNWRSEFVPNGFFIESDLPVELEAKKAYWIYKTKRGCPAVLVTGRNHVYNKADFDEFKRFVVYSIDRVIRESPPNSKKFIALVDLKGLGVKNLDSKSFLAAFEIIQKHYPGRLGAVFLMNVPLIFNGVWKVVKPFLSEETKKKIVFVDKNKLVETLTNEIDLEFLPKDYGGLADLVLLQDAKTPNWPPNS